MAKTNKNSTRHAFRALTREIGTGRHAYEAWTGMNLDMGLEVFTKQAKAYLGDKTEFKTSTIDSADYAEILAHFQEWKAREVAPLVAYAIPVGALAGDVSQAELDLLSMEAFGTTDPSEVLDRLLAESVEMFPAPMADALPLDPWA